MVTGRARARAHTEPAAARRAVVDARETVTRLALRIDARVATDEGASVLVHDRHPHGDPNSDVPTREARGDQHDLRVVACRDEQIPAGDDRDPVGPRSEAAALRARVDPVAEARMSVRLHDRHTDRARHADLAAGRARDDRDDRVLCRRGDRHVLRRVDPGAVIDVGVRLERDEVHAHADADADRPRDGDRRGDRELVILIAGGDAHRLLGIRAYDVRRARGAAVDLGGLADVRGGVHVHHFDGAGQVHRGRPGESGAHADRGDVVAVRRCHAHSAGRVGEGHDRARSLLSRVARGLRSRLH